MKEAGLITITDPERDGSRTIPTYQCVHCGMHWVASPGSGKVRGWCLKCNGPVCGPGCAECVPKERQLENIEAGRDPRTPAPPMVQSAGGIWMPGDK